MIVIVNGNSYEMTENRFKDLVNIAKDKYKKESVNAIVAVRKDDTAEMKRETFTDVKLLNAAIMDYNKQGFLCNVQRIVGPRRR